MQRIVNGQVRKIERIAPRIVRKKNYESVVRIG
jgi:hypothetical protein